jgi:hypothetical protein
MKIIGEVFFYGLFVAVVGLLSVWPRYELVGEQQAIISLSLTHAGKRIGECRTLSQEELDKLPPNMRKPADCPRERHSVRVTLRSGAAVLYEETIAPTGLWSDGKASIYRRVVVDAGPHELFIGMNDSGRESGYDYEMARRVDIAPGRNLTIQFDGLEQEFRIQ